MLIFIEGFFTFSLAFFLMVFISFLIYIIHLGFVKTSICLLLFAAMVVFFFTYHFESEQLQQLQSRFDFTSFMFFKDNRTNDAFDKFYKDMFNGNMTTILFGYGNGYAETDAVLSGSYSYKNLIVDYGIIGGGLYIIFPLLVMLLKSGINKKSVAFCIAFMVSIYQRPYVLTQQYLLLLFSALSYLDETPSNPFHSRRKRLIGEKHLRVARGNG